MAIALVQIPRVLKGVSKIDLRIGEIRLDQSRLLITRDCPVKPPKALEGIAQILVCFGKIGPEPNRLNDRR